MRSSLKIRGDATLALLWQFNGTFEEYQQHTNFISEKQNADGTYGNEKTGKAVLDPHAWYR
jgi:hypothetical protein